MGQGRHYDDLGQPEKLGLDVFSKTLYGNTVTYRRNRIAVSFGGGGFSPVEPDRRYTEPVGIKALEPKRSNYDSDAEFEEEHKKWERRFLDEWDRRHRNLTYEISSQFQIGACVIDKYYVIINTFLWECVYYNGNVVQEHLRYSGAIPVNLGNEVFLNLNRARGPVAKGTTTSSLELGQIKTVPLGANWFQDITVVYEGAGPSAVTARIYRNTTLVRTAGIIADSTVLTGIFAESAYQSQIDNSSAHLFGLAITNTSPARVIENSTAWDMRLIDYEGKSEYDGMREEKKSNIGSKAYANADGSVIIRGRLGAASGGDPPINAHADWVAFGAGSGQNRRIGIYDQQDGGYTDYTSWVPNMKKLEAGNTVVYEIPEVHGDYFLFRVSTTGSSHTFSGTLYQMPQNTVINTYTYTAPLSSDTVRWKIHSYDLESDDFTIARSSRLVSAPAEFYYNSCVSLATGGNFIVVPDSNSAFSGLPATVDLEREGTGSYYARTSATMSDVQFKIYGPCGFSETKKGTRLLYLNYTPWFVPPFSFEHGVDPRFVFDPPAVSEIHAVSPHNDTTMGIRGNAAWINDLPFVLYELLIVEKTTGPNLSTIYTDYRGSVVLEKFIAQVSCEWHGNYLVAADPVGAPRKVYYVDEDLDFNYYVTAHGAGQTGSGHYYLDTATGSLYYRGSPRSLPLDPLAGGTWTHIAAPDNNTPLSKSDECKYGMLLAFDVSICTGAVVYYDGSPVVYYLERPDCRLHPMCHPTGSYFFSSFGLGITDGFLLYNGTVLEEGSGTLPFNNPCARWACWNRKVWYNGVERRDTSGDWESTDDVPVIDEVEGKEFEDYVSIVFTQRKTVMNENNESETLIRRSTFVANGPGNIRQSVIVTGSKDHVFYKPIANKEGVVGQLWATDVAIGSNALQNPVFKDNFRLPTNPIG